MRGGKAAYARLCACPMAHRSRMSLCALTTSPAMNPEPNDLIAADDEYRHEGLDSAKIIGSMQYAASNCRPDLALVCMCSCLERAPQITSRRLLLPRPTIPPRRPRPLQRRRPSPLPFMFLWALLTAPRPLPPPLTWLWVPPTESRRLPLPRPLMSPLASLLSPPIALLMTHTLPLTLVWILKRLLHPPSLPHANGRGAVRAAAWPEMNASANVGRLSSSPRKATRRLARDPHGRLATRRGTRGKRRGGQRRS